jgi:tetratricopeptide (TPR) repeat protein
MKSSICKLAAGIAVVLFAVACNNEGDKKSRPSADAGPTPELVNLRKSIALRPDSLGLRYMLMDELLKNKLYNAALAQNDTLLKVDTSSAAVWYRRGDILLQKGDTAASILSLQNALKGGPLFMEPQLQLAAIYANQSKGEAITVADKIIQYAQDQKYATQARFIKGLYFSNINEKTKALEQFNECIKNDYTFLDAYVEKGLLLYDLKKYAEALKVFEQTVQVSNSFAEGYYNAGRCEEALGNKQEAVSYYKKTLGLDNAFTAARDALKRLGE